MEGTRELLQSEGEDVAIEKDGPEVENARRESQTAAFRSVVERFKHGIDDDKDGRKGDAGPTLRSSSRKRPNTENGESNSTRSPATKKRRRESSRYAPPSKYAHLPPLIDILEPNLIGVFVGFNPGVTTAATGHSYAHPSNMFWKLLHSSGITDTRLRPEQDVDLPRLCRMGNTNIVERPSRNAGELSKAEVIAGTPILEAKIRRFRPEAVCIVGKSIWLAIWRWRYGREMRKEEFAYGWQGAGERMGRSEEWEGAWVFVATATSGLNASLKPAEKEAIWRPFGEWVRRRRREREKVEEEERKALQ